MEGRFHFYEGYSMQEVTFPVRVMKALGAEVLLITNAAGGMNPHFELADLIVIEDHIKPHGRNPLRGRNDDTLGPRFPDMAQPYDKRLMALARQTALEMGIPLSPRGLRRHRRPEPRDAGRVSHAPRAGSRSGRDVDRA